MAQIPTPPAEPLELNVLRLDPENPRLPSRVQGSDQRTLLEYLAENYNIIEVAASIARFGYFSSEPLIAIPDGQEHFTVVEGNRRLAALLILRDPSLAEELEEVDEWIELAEEAELPETVPVVLVEDRQKVAPIIGYRHISGIEPWKPYQKARFVKDLIERGSSFDEVADIVGERRTEVASLYRNHEIVEQAESQFKLDTTKVINNFSVFSRALNSPSLRSYIGAPATSEVKVDSSPLSVDKPDNVEDLFSWLFGDDKNDSVITESRDLTRLGRAVGSELGVKTLKKDRDLQAAYEVAGGFLDRLIRRLTRAHANLVGAQIDLPAYTDNESVQSLLLECQEALDSLLALEAKEDVEDHDQSAPADDEA